jgi:site-specific recombinase XerD
LTDDRQTAYAPPVDDVRVTDLRASWKRSLSAQNKVRGTIRVYLAALDHFVAVCGDMPIRAIRRRDVEHFIADRLETWMPATVSIDYRALQQFFKWAIAEDELEQNPMAHMKPPTVPVTPPPIVSDDAWSRLLAATRGSGFNERRDQAILYLFRTSGVRLNELTRILLSDISVNDRRATVHGKGRKDRVIAFDLQAANALERYLRVRRRHPQADLPNLWLGHQGPLTANGLYQAIRRRARSAAVEVHPHLFRHTFAHDWLEAGGQESALQEIAGWSSPQMLRRYAASSANARALSQYDRVMLRKTPERD